MTTMATAAPDWDLSPFFDALDSESYRAFRSRLVTSIGELAARFDALGPVAERADDWAEALARLEQLSAEYRHLDSYLGCVNAAESANEVAQREEAQAARLGASLEKIFVAVRAGFKAAGDDAFAALLADERLADTGHHLRRLRTMAARTMDASLEGLSADLAVDGIGAWGRLYDKVSGNLELTLAVPGQEPRQVPVAMTRSLLEDADPAVRNATRDGAAAAWDSVADTVAACLNAISGTRLSLYRRRGIDDFLEPALFDGAISRGTLDTMWQVVRERQEVARRFVRRKASLLGVERLGFHDLGAPLPGAGDARIPWDDARARVLDAFGAGYPALASFAAHAFDKRWIDHAARPSKRPGGFCTSSPVVGESRIFMTYHGAMGDVQTLAHELGHAFHNWLMKDQRWWSRRYPMTLAETASTFAESLVTDALLSSDDTDDAVRASILDTRLQDAEAFLLNIPTRFDFEYELYQRRADGELSVSELKAMMQGAQRKNYGDALADDGLDPWFWASKLHFYITDVSFYNFPYTFGYLFSTGLFARYKAEGAAFLPRYEALLRATGSAPAEEVAREALGVDLTRPDFWNASIDLVEADLDRFEALTAP